jgi:hypothetical protein
MVTREETPIETSEIDIDPFLLMEEILLLLGQQLPTSQKPKGIP